MARRSTLLVLVLLVAPAFALVPSADACAAGVGVPCGRIYPQISIRIPDQAPVYNTSQAEPLVLDAELTFRFDMANEGYTVPSPNDPIVIRFEYPRKPKWADIAVEPEAITVPVHDPRFAQADPTASTPQAVYVYTVPIKITATQLDQAVLRDGYDYAKLLVFAKSTESGLYQAGYGIKEIRVAPEGAIHESDLAGSRDVFTASPLPALAVEPVAASVAGVSVALEPPASAAFWEPASFGVTVSPAFRGSLVVALHDEWGNLVAQTGALDASSGAARFDATLVKPGLHTASVTLLPAEGEPILPMTIPLDFVAGDLGAEGWEFPKSYVAQTTQAVPAPTLNRADPLAQFERDVPFFAFDTAQSITASVTLVTPALDALGRSVANLQFSILDPDGNLLAQKSVDPTKPTDALRVGSLPSDGWYTVRLNGAGLPSGASYTVKVEGAYAQPTLQRNRADGVADATGGLLGRGGRNVTIPAELLQLWLPGDLTPAVEGADALRYSLTVYDQNGTIAYATGMRQGPASFSAPAPESYRAYVYVEPVAPATAFSPVVRAFAFGVGNDTETTATSFTLADTYEPSSLPVAQPVGIHQIRVHPSASLGGTVRGTDILVGFAAPGEEPPEGGSLTAIPLDQPVVIAYVTTPAVRGPAASPSLELALEYPGPVTLVGSDLGARSDAPLPQTTIPFVTIGALLGLVGLAAVAFALVRRR